jgi:hypothetical protein
MPVPSVRELDVSSASAGPAESLVGGVSTAHLSLEYLVDTDAASPSIKVTVVSGGSTSTWEETSPATTYQCKGDLMSVEPGTRLTLEASGATARLRWCETICC